MRILGRIAGLTIAVVSLTTILGSWLIAPSAQALTGSDFKAGQIIDDYTFYNSTTMTIPEVQTFLNAKVPVCDTSGTGDSGHPKPGGGNYTRAEWGQLHGNPPPFTCLKSYSQNNPTKAADSYCSQINGGIRSAAQIIGAVASACHLNPQTLVVMLQKEQGLVTDVWPWTVQYTNAMGYGCPDSGSCDPAYAGFMNQLYNAAHQFQVNKAGFYNNYHLGSGNRIYFSPPTSTCPSPTYSLVNIVNQATSSLYTYTPYQPNTVVLANTFPTGDSRGPGPDVGGCGAYGNRNFWWYFNSWFGSTSGPFYYQSSKIAPPTQLEYGQVSPTIEFKIVNNSSQTWYSDGHTPAGVRPFRLMTLGYTNTPFANTGDTRWLGQNQVKMVEASVAPGAIATFDFTLKAPQYSMSTNILFELVQDGVQVHGDQILSAATTSVPDYAYKVISLAYPPGILPGDAYKISIVLKNIGGQTWYSDGNVPAGKHPIRLAASGYRNTPYAHPALEPAWLGTQNQIKLSNASVAPGGNGTFSAVIYAPYASENFTHDFRLVLDGVKFIGGPSMPVKIYTPAPIATYSIVSRSTPGTMRSGTTATASVTLRNTGNIIWRNIHRKVPSLGSEMPLRDVRMFTWAPGYHTSAFWAGTPEWIGSKNQLTPSSAVVGPGKNATYTVTFKAPPVSRTTYYNEQWNLVLDGWAVMPFQSLTFPITVTP